MTDQQPPGRIKDIRVYRDSFIGMIVLACVPFLIFAAKPVYSWWAAIGMFLGWLVLLSLGARWFMPHPRWVLYAGIGGVAMWVAVVALNRI